MTVKYSFQNETTVSTRDMRLRSSRPERRES